MFSVPKVKTSKSCLSILSRPISMLEVRPVLLVEAHPGTRREVTPIGKVADDRVSLGSIRLCHRQPRCNVALIGREPTDSRQRAAGRRLGRLGRETHRHGSSVEGQVAGPRVWPVPELADAVPTKRLHASLWSDIDEARAAQRRGVSSGYPYRPLGVRNM
jgi:hypothetical protein